MCKPCEDFVSFRVNKNTLRTNQLITEWRQKLRYLRNDALCSLYRIEFKYMLGSKCLELDSIYQ